MKLSIIIPTLNEEAEIGKLLVYLQQHTSIGTEIIVADGQSTDATRRIAEEMGARVLLNGFKGRAPQMNAGAMAASGDVLYFLHADTYPPAGFEAQIRKAVEEGFGSGCFRLKFDVPHWFLRINAWFTRFDVNAVRFGDQSLFVLRDIFHESEGFDERLLLLEDQEIIERLRRIKPFIVLPHRVTTSARKYKVHGIYRLQVGYYLIYTLYKLGVPQEQLMLVYKRLLRKG
ncbi:TIGR04283 family arsenosugar biosynthesis glycosyltransferase [Pontibacter rugosus]|uniref:TIGR04283 family arsenosugar biosynthesis glycosyltransferase n=1 Tax=Pontibacter rugosus TaxID=1745966 RepID=A0ABW3SRE7_9BACT